MNRIKTRSPFLIKYSETNLDSAVIEFYIYTGTRATDQPASPQYTAEVEALDNSDEIVFDAAEIIEDYLTVEFDGNYNSQMVWVDYVITPTVSTVEQAAQPEVNMEAFLGYLDHIDGAQNLSRANDTNKILMTNTTVYVPSNSDIKIPVISDSGYSIYYYNGSTLLQEETISSTSESSERIHYIGLTDSLVSESLAQRALLDGGTSEVSESCLGTISIGDVDKIIVDNTTINISTLECTKFDNYKLTFINKFGALQDIWFTGKTTDNIDLKGEGKYKRNTLSSDSYSINKHRSLNIDKNGVGKGTLSTGFLKEEFNQVFEELMLSTKVWLEKDGVVHPIMITDRNFKYKTQLNEKLINYEIKIEYAYDKINNVR